MNELVDKKDLLNVITEAVKGKNNEKIDCLMESITNKINHQNECIIEQNKYIETLKQEIKELKEQQNKSLIGRIRDLF